MVWSVVSLGFAIFPAGSTGPTPHHIRSYTVSQPSGRGYLNVAGRVANYTQQSRVKSDVNPHYPELVMVEISN